MRVLQGLDFELIHIHPYRRCFVACLICQSWALLCFFSEVSFCVCNQSTQTTITGFVMLAILSITLYLYFRTFILQFAVA